MNFSTPLRCRKMASKEVFVTVGTTRFDLLVSAITAPDILQVLEDRGYKKIKLQIGNGNLPTCKETEKNIEIEHYRFKDSIAEDIKRADLVISHAGAGSCLETLEAGKYLVVVINEELMGNHQVELAEQLFADKHLYYTTCGNLKKTLQSMDLTKLRPFKRGNPSAVIEFLDKRFGFT